MYFKLLRLALASAAAVGAVQPGALHAQAWIGEMVGNMMAAQQAAIQEHNCMTGTTLPESEIAEARTPGAAAMPAYFDAARAGSPLSPQFHLDKRTRWVGGGATATMADLDRQKDPFAGAGLVLDPEPLALVRSGDGSTAQGQWRVRDASGAVAGTYTGLFTRKVGVWRFSTLQLTPPTTYADPVVQYCHKPGDVLPYRLATTGRTRQVLEKRVANNELKAQKAAQAAAAARAKADNSPTNASAGAAAEKAEARARALATQLDARRTELAGAKTAEVEALADAKAAEDAKTAAIAALGTAK